MINIGTPGLDFSPILAFIFLLGSIIGSFINVVIYRLPRMMESEFKNECLLMLGEARPTPSTTYNLAIPRSACPNCNKPITFYDNIPILSWLILKGRCRHCKTAISWRYPAIELLTAIMTTVAFVNFGLNSAGIGAAALSWMLITLFFIDIDTFLLPDSVTLPLLWLGLGFNILGTFTTLSSAVVGAMSGYLCLWSIYWVFKLTTGKEGMGYGDFKLLAALGAWLGWQLLPVVILISSVVGASIGIVLIVFARRDAAKPIPFGPYLATAGLITLYFGPWLSSLIWSSGSN